MLHDITGWGVPVDAGGADDGGLAAALPVD
jgi:hypothetical protein